MGAEPVKFFSPAPRPADEAARQAAVDRIRFTRATDDPRLAEIVREAAALMGSPSAAISIVDGDRQNWVVRTGLEQDGTARALSFCGHVVFQPDRVLSVPDALRDERFAGNPLVTGAMAGVRFYAGAPLVQDGAALGALCVVNDSPQRDIDQAQRETLTRLAGEVSAILANYR